MGATPPSPSAIKAQSKTGRQLNGTGELTSNLKNKKIKYTKKKYDEKYIFATFGENGKKPVYWTTVWNATREN